MKCLNCNKNKARKVEPYGYLPCSACTNKQRKYKANEAVEITTQDIKEERKKYYHDILQKYRGDTPSKEYIDRYGTKNFTKAEVKRSAYVWNESSYYKHEG